MNLTLDTQLLSEALNKVQAVIDRKNSRPLLTNYLFEAKNNQLIITGTDLEVSVKVHINCQVEIEGKFCINAKGITEIVRELPQGSLNLTIANNNLLKLNAHNINYSLLIIDSQDYPFINFEHTKEKITLSTKEILEIISKTSYAISTDETRIFLNGIYLEQIGQTLRAVAIDGHRLALLDTDTHYENNEKLTKGIIIPRKGITELKKILDINTNQEIEISLDDSFIYFSSNDSDFLSIRLIARDYPKYESVIPNKTSSTLNFNKDNVLQAVKRIKLLSNEKTNGIKLKISNNNLIIEANHPSLGEAREEVSINYSGEPIEIGFNAKYLIDSLSIFNTPDVIFEFNNELSPVIVKSEKLPKYLGIIMPLKI